MGNGFTVPVDFDRLTLLAGLAMIAALAILASAVVHLARERHLGIGQIGGGLVMILVALVVFAIAGWAQTYHQLTHNELVAYINAVPTGPQRIQVTYTPVHGGTRGTPRTYTIHGDQWELGGDVVKWQNWVNILGVDTGYRVSRLDGYYTDPNDYKTKPVSVFDLGQGRDAMETFLHDHGNLVPFIRATYHNATAQVPDPENSYRVYVSTSGYWTSTQ